MMKNIYFSLKKVQENYRARYPSQSSASKYSAYSNGGTGTSVSLWKNGVDSSSVIGAVLKFEPKDVDVNYLFEKLAVDRNRIHPMKLELEGRECLNVEQHSLNTPTNCVLNSCFFYFVFLFFSR